MKDNYEWEQGDLLIPYYMEVDSDAGREITAYIGAWEDMSGKFGVKADRENGVSLHLYAKYNPYEDTLRIEGEIDAEDGRPGKTFDYDAPDCELKLVKMLVIEAIKDNYRMTPEEFCESAAQRKRASQMDADEYANAYEPFFPKSMSPYQPQDNATIRFTHTAFFEDGKFAGAGWYKGHQTYDGLLADDFTKEIMKDRGGKAITVKIGHYEYGSGAVHRDVSEDEFTLLCKTALHNGGERLVGEETYTISQADLLSADEDEAQDFGLTMQ